MSDTHEELMRAQDTNRYHVHGQINSAIGIDADMAFTITMDGQSEEEVQAIVFDLFKEPVDITEIEDVS